MQARWKSWKRSAAESADARRGNFLILVEKSVGALRRSSSARAAATRRVVERTGPKDSRTSAQTGPKVFLPARIRQQRRHPCGLTDGKDRTSTAGRATRHEFETVESLLASRAVDASRCTSTSRDLCVCASLWCADWSRWLFRFSPELGMGLAFGGYRNRP